MVDTSLIFNLIGKDKATKVLGGVGEAFGKLGRKASSALEGASEQTDRLATKTGVMTGALGAVGGGLALIGLEKYEKTLETAQIASDLVSGASDILTLALESQKIRWILTRAAALGGRTATLAAAGASRIAAAGQWALNAAMSANPIGLVVAALVILIGIFVVAYKHSETFRRIVQAAFHGVLAAASATWHWIQHNWPLLLAVITGPIGIAVYVVARHWNSIKHGASSAKAWIVREFNLLVGWFRGLPGRFASSQALMFVGLYAGFRHQVNRIIGGWNRLRFTVPSVDTHIPGVGRVGGFSIGTPNIPYLARGGNITRAGFAVVGERGPEVVHLGRGAEVSPLGAGRQVIELRLTGSGNGLERLFLSWLKGALRANPGVDLVVA